MRTMLSRSYSPCGVAALALLVVNDHLLKATFQSWFTGKLSDFAGLFLFPLVVSDLLALCGHGLARSSVVQPVVATLTGLGFTWIKMEPGNGWAIAWIDALGLPLRIAQDSSDLIALAVLPWASFYRRTGRAGPREVCESVMCVRSFPSRKRFLEFGFLAMSCLAFLSTSVDYDEEEQMLSPDRIRSVIRPEGSFSCFTSPEPVLSSPSLFCRPSLGPGSPPGICYSYRTDPFQLLPDECEFLPENSPLRPRLSAYSDLSLGWVEGNEYNLLLEPPLNFVADPEWDRSGVILKVQDVADGLDGCKRLSWNEIEVGWVEVFRGIDPAMVDWPAFQGVAGPGVYFDDEWDQLAISLDNLRSAPELPERIAIRIRPPTGSGICRLDTATGAHGTEGQPHAFRSRPKK